MTIDELCVILKAYGEGKTIQCNISHSGWRGVVLRNWSVEQLLETPTPFRIKPEPREIYGYQFSDQLPVTFSPDKEHAERVLGSLGSDWRVVKFREVLDE